MNPSALIPLATAIPLTGFAILSSALLLGCRPREKVVNTAISCLMIAHFLCLSLLVWKLLSSGLPSLPWTLGTWFEGDSHPFDLELFVDKSSAMILWVSSFLCSAVGFFSTKYLHREGGFHRYFALFLLFVASVSLVFTAANLDLLIVGWELLGISSVLLIGFFQFRSGPIQGSLYALVTYRICDTALIAAVLLSHHWAPLHFWEPFRMGSEPGVTLIATLLVIGCLGKSAQLPFSSWLPRAMEGPTPSSAVFYGAVSAQMGAFLLLRVSPIWRMVPFLPPLVIGIGLTTALYAAFCGRTRSDAKTQLAFAAIAQLGLVFVEIGLGWETLAVVHLIGHSLIRTLQFLKTPSLLHEFNKMGARGKRLFQTSLFLVEWLIPRPLQRWLYWFAMWEGHLPRFVENGLVRPFQRLITSFDAAERKWGQLFEHGIEDRESIKMGDATWN